jgi:hypothetical protein
MSDKVKPGVLPNPTPPKTVEEHLAAQQVQGAAQIKPASTQAQTPAKDLTPAPVHLIQTPAATPTKVVVKEPEPKEPVLKVGDKVTLEGVITNIHAPQDVAFVQHISGVGAAYAFPLKELTKI